MSVDAGQKEHDRRLAACADLVRRTGAATFQMRYSDDEKPVVWMAVATYPDGRGEAAASLDPLRAAVRLAEQLVDGAMCTHCHQPTALITDFTATLTDVLPQLCEYVYDPEMATFRRSCE